MYACMYRLFAGMWCPLVSVITTLYCVAKIIFHRRVCYRMLSLRYMFIRSSGIILIPRLPSCQILFLSWPPLLQCSHVQHAVGGASAVYNYILATCRRLADEAVYA